MTDAIDSTQGSGVNQADYLKLFMQELTYQDPLKPIDNREFMAQMAQFSALQEAQSTNQSLNQLLSMTSGNQSLMLLGKYVKFAGSNESLKVEGIHVALALFDDMEHSLVAAHDNLFRAKNTHDRHIGRPNQQGFGTLQPKKLESSNVDSTTEFANIVVLQRMFQACSQIMDIDKQLLEELYKK